MSSEDVNRLRLVLLRLVRNIRSNYAGSVTPSQLAILASLGKNGPSSVGQLAEYEHVQPPSASRTVAALEAQGLVERQQGVLDRRCTTISLSEDGRRYLDQLKEAGTSWLSSRLDRLPSEDTAAVVAALPALERLLEVQA